MYKTVERNEIMNKEPDEKVSKKEQDRRDQIKTLANQIADRNDQALKRLSKH